MRYAVCNELFGQIPFTEACRMAKEEWFEGMGIASFTIFGDFIDAVIGRVISEASHCRFSKIER
jgi:hypothetical protein